MSFSRIPGFYRAELAARRDMLATLRELSEDELEALETGGLALEVADGMIENVIGRYALPMGLGLNFQVNQRDYLIPMVVEEPSVVAAASNAARMVREGGGFRAEVSPPVMIGQVQITDIPDMAAAVSAIEAQAQALLEQARAFVPGLVERGGGPVGLTTRVLEDEREAMLIVHILVDCRDAMGANMVNTLAEGLADSLAELAGGQPGLRILSNLADERTVTVTARIPDQALALSSAAADAREQGAAVKQAIVAASRFAELDPYRAATHNKGIMNGVDAVLMATGNDWRSVEAGAHAFAARDGRYRPLAVWCDTNGALEGRLHLPMAVGMVGGALHVHAGARAALAILGVRSACELAGVIGSVGLASNLSALRALATEGIQRGHMSLHARMVARSAGASGEEVEQVASQISDLGDIRIERARQVLAALRGHEPRDERA